MFGLGTWEMVIIVVAALIFIGPGKLPELAKTLGKGMREVRRAMAGFESEARSAVAMPSGDEAEGKGDRQDDQESGDKGKPETEATDLAQTNAPPPSDTEGNDAMPEYQAPEGPRVAAGRPGPASASGQVDDEVEGEGEGKAKAKSETPAEAS